jgi:transcriptional regulator with XRE-family HTH domain
MKVEQIIMPRNLKIIQELGENIMLARLRRKLSAGQVAERAGIARKTLHRIESGSPSVALGSYLQVLFVLGLQEDLRLVAANDPLGRKLLDAGITVSRRAPKRKG